MHKYELAMDSDAISHFKNFRDYTELEPVAAFHLDRFSALFALCFSRVFSPYH